MRRTLFFVVIIICISLPSCLSNTCEMLGEITIHLNITEDVGDVSGGESRFIYNFLDGEPSGSFTVAENVNFFSTYFQWVSGTLSTIGLIDREDIASLLSDTYNPVRFEFGVYLYTLSGIRYRCIDVVLHVIDLDDNSPMFAAATQTVMFLDNNEAVGEERPILTAGDHDEGTNGTSVYELVGDTEKFELVFRNYTNSTRVQSLSLRNIQPLDHEEQSSYNVLLYAREGNDNPDEAVLDITVEVTDLCDEPPIFTTSRYMPNISEDANINSPIVEVVVNDLDNRTVCPLQYRITRVCGRRTASLNCIRINDHPFTLDSESGHMTLQEELDRETIAVYEVTVQARDSDQSSATATVEVTIEDINDNDPHVVHNILGQIPEHQMPNPSLSIGHFTVSDEDAGRNGQVSVFLLDNSSGVALESQTFRLTTEDHILYQIILNRSLDYETQTEFHLVIQVRDNGTQQRTVNFPKTIAIFDSNDHPPVFAPLPTVLPIAENSVWNTHVVNVMATDLDSGTNAHIIYELPESNEEYPHQHLFQIEEEIGQISVGNNGVLDYELFTHYRILVVAKNARSSDPLSNSTVVTIPLENTNDNEPQITLPVSTIEAREDTDVGDTLGQVIATDADNLGALNYSITSFGSLFSISGDGSISLRGELDFETEESYSVSVVVSDGLYENSTVVTIDVLPVNDERPYFTHDGSYYDSVLEEEDEGTLVLTVVAADRDIPQQILHFSIDGGIHMERFTINSMGEIRTAEVLDREATPNYTLWIRVSDGEFFSPLKEVVIIVTDINDHTPHFINQPYNFMIDEHNAVDEIVGTVEVVSLDTGANQEVHFEIPPDTGNNWFSIDENGVISTNVILDRESNIFPNPIEFTVIVRDMGPNPRTNVTEVNVTIVDINDNGPIFDKDLYDFELREDFPIGQVFGIVMARDADGIGNNVTRYSFSDSSDSSAFHIEELTGELSLVSSLDYETSNMSMFDIIATDYGQRDFQTSTTVRINITNARDLNLTFSNDFFPHFSVTENVEENHTITTLEVKDNMMNSVNRLEYTLTTHDDMPSPYFGIEKVGYVARIYTRTNTINREAEDLGDDKMYQLKLNVSDPDTTTDSYGYIVSYLTIAVQDENDNDPMFVDAGNDFYVMENGNAGQQVASFEVRDPDAGNNGTIHLAINSVVPFNVTHVEYSNGQQFAVIRVVSPLDRESQAIHQFFLQASDQGTPSRDAMVEINVHVMDENDNIPVFCSPENRPCWFTFEVREDHVIQQVIATVQASDPDDGTNADIRYEFVPGLLIGSRFSLEPNTGRIILGESLDCEMVENYEFEVRALDGGDRASTATVIIRVQDVNEYPPAFINSSFTITIAENSDTGVPFTSLIARDQDCAPNAVIGYTLADGSLSYIFEVNEHTGEISLSTNEYRTCGVIDYERVNEYKVGIIAYDHGSPRRYSNETLTVQITNVNEHTPTFDVPHLRVLMSENALVGSTVLVIRAYDNDTGDALQYSLSPGTPFNWDGENNALVLSSAIDYNPNSPSITVQVHVTDGEKDNQMTIIVLVVNENNHRPVFQSTDSTVSISENEDIGTIIFAVRASDADNATNDAIIYTISDGNVDNTFYINPKEGILQVAQDLDYERVDIYTLTIVATDTGEPARTSEPLLITVEIVNENDEVPVFEEEEYTFTLVENNVEMAQVGCVRAPDNDDGQFGIVVYSIVDEGENPGVFLINKNSGCIVATQIIDRETFPEFQLRVQAQDSANPALTDTVDVNVLIGDVNDNGPTFLQPIYLFYISPDHPISESVGTVTASDPDSDENAIFNYEIVTQSAQVEVSGTGAVTLTTAIPADYSTSYIIDVRTSSTVEGDTSSADATIMIIIETDTDHHPRFSQQMYEERVPESVSVGYSIFDASEVVNDEDGADGLTYSFVQDHEQFALDSETGLLTLQATLNYEDTRTYEVQIQATDTTSRTATATLRVTVEDSNDHAPVFVQMPTNLVFSPIPHTDIELFTVRAEDADDTGDQGTVEYSIVQSSSIIFAIDRETGVVTNTVNLVTSDTYVFVIRAFDHGSPLKSSNITVHIRIDDQVDPPRFSNDETSIDINVPEDKDHKTDPVIQGFSTQPVAESYHLVYSNASKDMFSIDVTTNELVLNSELDYETASHYQLIIEARSMSNGIRLSSFLLVNIIVTDTNDNAPHFLPIPRQVISETTPTNRVLFTVEAMDDDSAQNAEVTYVISDGNNGNAFDIDSTTGSVSLVEQLDRERIPNYNLTIRATDAGSPSLRNHTTVFIEVSDVNDNPPIFAHNNYSISVFEYPHTTIGDSIIQIVAKDADVGSVNYYLTLLQGTFQGLERNPSSDTFEIDFDTGNITAHRNLDREEIDSYFIRIEARDTDSEHTAVAYLTIKVIDVNDHTPVLTLTPGDVTVDELQPENSLVLDRLVVMDRDTGPNAIVKYSLGDNWPTGHFKIDPWTGVIRIDRPIEFDRELMEFDGTVFAVDQGVPHRTGSVTVRVFIQDVNNFPPVLDKTHYSLAVSVDHPVGSQIAKFNYSDERDNSFNTVTNMRIPDYYNDAFSLFEISSNEDSGMLMFLRKPDVDEIREHCFRIEAIQQSSIPICPQFIQATYARVCVTIHPTNVHAPEFPYPHITHDVLESRTIGDDLVYNDLHATDADGDSVSYSLLTDNIPFDILDPSRPIITITGHLDADSVVTNEYTIQVLANDDGFPVKSSSMTLVIRIIDVNDVSPVFEGEPYSGTIAENSDIGTSVLTVSAEDVDSDTISYSIDHSDESDLPFDITSGGRIMTNATIDFEMRESYQFRVKASDGVHSSYATVTIGVTGENEDPPVFREEVFEFTVTKDQADNSLVGSLEATDRDTGNDGKLLYGFADEIEEEYDVFVINETSGEIFLRVSPTASIDISDRRKRDVEVAENDVIVRRTVMVRDTGENPQSDTAEVSFTIDRSFFEGVVRTTGTPTEAAGTPFQIIIIVVIAVAAAIIIFVAIFVITLLCRRHLKKRKYKVEDTRMNGSSRNGVEMGTERFCQNNGTSLDAKTTTHTTKLQTGNSASGSERSYTGTADDEMDSGNERYTGHSPHLPNKPRRDSSSRARSTSDLASSVGTDVLHSQANEHPYTKAQLMRIYAANEGLLDDNISHDSVHMFGSEGGGEADGELDISNLIYQKINDLEDDEESTTIMDDDASTTYSKGRGTVLTGSVSNIDSIILPADDREDPLNYPDPRKVWIPPAGRPMEEAIDEITATSSFASQEEPLPRRHGYDMGAYSHSQGPSLYNPSATQDSYIGIQQPPKLYHNKRLHDYPRPYYAEDHQARIARERERERPRYTSNRYGSASVLPEYHHRPGHRQHYRSQDLAPPYPKYSPFIPGARRPVGNPHAYMTPTEGTDGTVTPQTALNGDYHYLSSSSTSLTSTNVSGNLSQPSRHPPMYNGN